jgi:hypothetical protein
LSYINCKSAGKSGTNRTTQAEISSLLRLSFPGRVRAGQITRNSSYHWLKKTGQVSQAKRNHGIQRQRPKLSHLQYQSGFGLRVARIQLRLSRTSGFREYNSDGGRESIFVIALKCLGRVLRWGFDLKAPLREQRGVRKRRSAI